MSSSRSAAPPAKRQRRFGAATEDDTLSVKPTYNNASNDDRVSTREISSTQGVPTLANICARVFVKHIQKLSADPELWDPTRAWLKIIPDTLINKLFAMLRTSCPTILSHGFIISVGTDLWLRNCANFRPEFPERVVDNTNERPSWCQSIYD